MSNIPEIIKKLKLKPELPLSDFLKKNKRFYSTPCQTEEGDRVFLKILLSQSKQDALRLKREAELNKFLSPLAKKNRGLNIPLLIRAQTKKKPYWLVHQYLPGPLPGYHFELYKQGLKKEVREKIINNLLALQSIPAKIRLKEKTAKYHLKTIQNFGHKVKLNKEIYQFFEKEKKYLNKDFLVLSHGDFTLANFLINRGRIYLTDWEMACLDNFAADISRLWIQTYKYPVWRRKLVLYFLAKLPCSRRENFKKTFRVMAMIEAVKEFACNVKLTIKENPLKKSMRQTIESAIKGFNNLINL